MVDKKNEIASDLKKVFPPKVIVDNIVKLIDNIINREFDDEGSLGLYTIGDIRHAPGFWDDKVVLSSIVDEYIAGAMRLVARKYPEVKTEPLLQATVSIKRSVLDHLHKAVLEKHGAFEGDRTQLMLLVKKIEAKQVISLGTLQGELGQTKH